MNVKYVHTNVVAKDWKKLAQFYVRLLSSGGSRLGELVEKEIPGVGVLTVVYARDPEGNIIEIQRWK